MINESALGEQLDGERENPVYNAYEQMSPEERQVEFNYKKIAIFTMLDNFFLHMQQFIAQCMNMLS